MIATASRPRMSRPSTFALTVLRAPRSPSAHTPPSTESDTARGAAWSHPPAAPRFAHPTSLSRTTTRLALLLELALDGVAVPLLARSRPRGLARVLRLAVV